MVLAALGGGWVALATFSVERELSMGTIELSAEPGREGALDLYVPLLDWGLRFRAVRAPVELRLDVRSIDRAAARRVASRDDVGSGSASARRVRLEPPPSDRDALAALRQGGGLPMRRIETPAASKEAGSRAPRPSTIALAPGRSVGARSR